MKLIRIRTNLAESADEALCAFIGTGPLPVLNGEFFRGAYAPLIDILDIRLLSFSACQTIMLFSGHSFNRKTAYRSSSGNSFSQIHGCNAAYHRSEWESVSFTIRLTAMHPARRIDMFLTTLMRRHFRILALVLTTLTLFSISGRSGVGQEAAAGTAAKRARTPLGPFHGNAAEFVPGAPTKSGGCVADGAFPDADCTPGGVMGITQEEICATSTKGRRHVTEQTKKQVFAAYGVSYPASSGAYEVDHFIPLELGGSNDVANLWPELAKPVPGFHEKDRVETHLHDQVCKAGMDLAEAQRTIVKDWLSYYRANLESK
jgi:hypothetical protein